MTISYIIIGVLYQTTVEMEVMLLLSHLLGLVVGVVWSCRRIAAATKMGERSTEHEQDDHGL